MRRHSCCSIGAAIAVASFFSATVVALLALLFYPPPNQCEEGTEAPVYTAVDIVGVRRDELPASYRLLHVAESSVPAGALPSTGARAVLFVPGNAGAFTQVKSMCAEAAKAGLPLDFYTVDLGSELVAFRGELLERQVRFVRHALRTVATLQPQQHTPTRGQRSVATSPPLLAVGHSMGGLVLRAALQHTVPPRSNAAFTPQVALLLTLGTPHAAPVIATEASVFGFYADLAYNEARTVPTPTISVSGGERDVQVPAHLCELSHRPGGRAVDLSAQAVRGVRGSVDHQCLSWCLPLIPRINEWLATVPLESNFWFNQDGQQPPLPPQQQRAGALKLDRLLWNVSTTGSVSNVQVQPATVLWREGPISLPAVTQNRVSTDVGDAGHDSATHVVYRLQVQQQWLALPQQLTLQCLNTNEVIDEGDSERGPRLFAVSAAAPAPAGVSAPVWIPPSAVVTSYTSSAAVLSYSYLLNPTGWATRSRILTTGPEKIQDTPVSNDLTLILDMQLAVDKLSNGGAEITLDCTVELAPNYWRAVAVFGHHQLGVVPSATTVMLMMIRSGFQLEVSSAALWHVCIGVVIWMHDIPLHLIIAAGGWIEAIVMVWSVTSVSMIIGGSGLLCTRYLRHGLIAPYVMHDATRTDGVVAAWWRHLKNCTVVLLSVAYMALFLLHPFETFVLVGCMHRGTGWWPRTSSTLQSPNFSSAMGDAAASSCTIGLSSPAARHQSSHTSSRLATAADYRNDSTYVLMILALVIRIPGIIAKWSSSGGLYGPLQGHLTSAADDAMPAESWEPGYLWMSATAVADTCTAIVFTWTAGRTGRQRSRLVACELAAWPTSSQPSYLRTWVTVGVAAMLGAVCSGRNIYAVPWAIATFLFAAMHGDEPKVTEQASPLVEMKQL